MGIDDFLLINSCPFIKKTGACTILKQELLPRIILSVGNSYNKDQVERTKNTWLNSNVGTRDVSKIHLRKTQSQILKILVTTKNFL